MSVQVFDGNIFTTKCQTIVNTVNCVGAMGAGIALECRLRYPDMYEQYVSLCERRLISIGSLWLYKGSNRWILNFPTKQHWKDPSREEYLHSGLQKFMSMYEEKAIQSAAFPLLGAQHGGLDRGRSQQIMESYLIKCSIPVEIYRYDPMAHDDLFDWFKMTIASMTITEIKDATGLRADHAARVLNALIDPSVCQLNQLAAVDGIGVKTLEKVFAFARLRTTSESVRPVQQALNL